MKKLAFTFSILFLAMGLSTSYTPAAEKPIIFKLSTEANEKNSANRGFKIFRTFLEKNSEGRLKVDYYHSSQLYSGKDEPKALKMGTLEMSAPGIWLLGGVDPNAGIFGLPMLYGLPDQFVTKVYDNRICKFLNERFEEKLDVKILGRWYWHGNAGVGTKDRPIKTLEDWKGLKIRSAGGAPTTYRLQCFGASSIVIPWPDVTMALIQGTVDGVLTGYGPVRAAKFWDAGLHYWTQDNSSLVFYVPMMNGKFWRSLPKDLQKIIIDTWEEHIEYERGILMHIELTARAEMEDNGMEIFFPPKEEIAKWRAKFLPLQDKIVEETKMNKDFVDEVQKYIEENLK